MTLTGEVIDIVEELKQKVFGGEDMTIDQYFAWIKDNVKRFKGIHIEITGNSFQEKAESLIRELDRAGLLKIEEE
jgi:hypothetical protein